MSEPAVAVPSASSMFAGHVNVRYEIGIQVIRADGTIDNFGTVTSTAWGRFSLRKLRPWFLIKRANWRNRQRIKAG